MNCICVEFFFFLTLILLLSLILYLPCYHLWALNSCHLVQICIWVRLTSLFVKVFTLNKLLVLVWWSMLHIRWIPHWNNTSSHDTHTFWLDDCIAQGTNPWGLLGQSGQYVSWVWACGETICGELQYSCCVLQNKFVLKTYIFILLLLLVIPLL